MAGTRLQPAGAAPPPPPPPASIEPWSICQNDTEHYCISRFEVDGENRLANPSQAMKPIVYGTSQNGGSDITNRVEWNVHGENGQALSEALRDKPITLTIRTGQLFARSGGAFAGPTFSTVTGSAEAGWELEITTVAGLQQTSSGSPADPAPEHATMARLVCSGMNFDELQDTGYPVGQYLSSNAMTMTPPFWREGGWMVNLYAPHFAFAESTPDGLTHAHYTAWMSPGNLATMGLTLAEALSGQLTVTRIEAGVATPVAAELREHADGMLLQIADMTFSSPTIRVAPVSSATNGNKKRKKKKKKNKKKKKR